MLEEPNVLTITEQVRESMFAHAVDGLPNEACGLFSGEVGTTKVDVFHPMINAAESNVIYLLDSQEHLRVQKEVDEDIFKIS